MTYSTTHLVYNAKKNHFSLNILYPITFKLRIPGERMQPTPTPNQDFYEILENKKALCLY